MTQLPPVYLAMLVWLFCAYRHVAWIAWPVALGFVLAVRA